MAYKTPSPHLSHSLLSISFLCRVCLGLHAHLKPLSLWSWLGDWGGSFLWKTTSPWESLMDSVYHSSHQHAEITYHVEPMLVFILKSSELRFWPTACSLPFIIQKQISIGGDAQRKGYEHHRQKQKLSYLLLILNPSSLFCIDWKISSPAWAKLNVYSFVPRVVGKGDIFENDFLSLFWSLKQHFRTMVV